MDPISAAAIALAIGVTGYIAWRLRRMDRTERERKADAATATSMAVYRNRFAERAAEQALTERQVASE